MIELTVYFSINGIIAANEQHRPTCTIVSTHICYTLQKIILILYSGDDYTSGKIKVTVGGDQLTRSHLDSAKSLTAGMHTPTERLDQLDPIVEEFFHVQQDLLEVQYT